MHEELLSHLECTDLVAQQLDQALRLLEARDVEAGAVSFRFRDGSQRNGVPVDDAVQAIAEWVASRTNVSPDADSFPAS